MADQEQVELLMRGVDAWNAWRAENERVRVNLREANLQGTILTRASLRGADLRGAILSEANLYGTDLYGANLNEADFSEVNLYETLFVDVDLSSVRGGASALPKGPHPPQGRPRARKPWKVRERQHTEGCL